MSFSGEDNPEIRVELKLHFEWKTSFTLMMTYDATMFDKDAGEVDAHVNKSVSIALGAVEHVVIDMSSGEIEPDEAHIDFTVAYG